ncbi:2-oxoacid:acceptor oxidoreductase family protein, partial [Alistipes ihumii]
MEGENHISERDDVVIRFSGDSGDGMQMTGKLFTDTAALMGNGISTFPDFPAEIRAPQGTVSGVSGFQVHIGDHPVSTPGDYCDVLVAMNPAALRANARWLKPGATIICDGDTFNDRSVERAGFRTFDPVTEMNLQDYN